MRVSRKDFEWAAARGGVSASQAEEVWRALEERGSGRARFDLPNVAYYFGALVVISAMTWFVTLGWERFGGGGIMVIALLYAAVFAAVGALLWRAKDLRVPGGLLVTAAVCMAPLTVYGFERMTGLWPQEVPGQYQDFYQWISGGWFFMEVATVTSGLAALRFFRFAFLTAPVAFALWFMSMDLTPLIYGADYYDESGYQTVSLVFGLVLLAASFLIDNRLGEDYAFWGYLFGMMSFWGGLSMLGEGSEVGWAVYGLINLGLILLSVLLQRRVFVVFGAAGVFGYVGHLAWEIFEDSMLFPFALSAIGLAVIALGILYARNKERIERTVLEALPDSVRSMLPRERAS